MNRKIILSLFCAIFLFGTAGAESTEIQPSPVAAKKEDAFKITDLFSTILGGVLAAGTGWFLQYRLEASRTKRLKNLMIMGITDDLTCSSALFDRVIDEWEKTQIVWFNTINELRESRQIYIKNRDWLVLIENDDLRQRIFKYYHRSSNHLNLLENQQRRKYEIIEKLHEIVRDVRFRDLSLTLASAQKQAIDLMPEEEKELTNIDQGLPQNIQKIRDFKHDGDILLRDIITSNG